MSRDPKRRRPSWDPPGSAARLSHAMSHTKEHITPELSGEVLAGTFPGDLGIEPKTNVFAAAREGDLLEATGRPVHVGRRTQVWQVDGRNAGRPAALFVWTQMVLAPKGR